MSDTAMLFPILSHNNIEYEARASLGGVLLESSLEVKCFSVLWRGGDSDDVGRWS